MKPDCFNTFLLGESFILRRVGDRVAVPGDGGAVPGDGGAVLRDGEAVPTDRLRDRESGVSLVSAGCVTLTSASSMLAPR